MLKRRHYLIISFIVSLAFPSCSGDETSSPVSQADDDSVDAVTFVLAGYGSSEEEVAYCRPSGFSASFYIKDKSFYGESYSFTLAETSSLSDLTVPTDADWSPQLAITEGSTYWIRYATQTQFNYLKCAVTSISGENVTLSYVIADTVDARSTTDNANANDEADGDYACNLETPSLLTGDIFVSHTTTYQSSTVLTYSLEWNTEMLHSRWVAFSFNSVTGKKNVNRPDDEPWAEDPLLNLSVSLSTMHTGDGFDRGHLCASNDRVYTTESNAQTFYYSNMSPQLNAFNTGFWASLESLVQSWGRSCCDGDYDNVYVVKGGTLDRLLTDFTGVNKGGDGTYPTTDSAGFTVGGLPCPNYYFMAILTERSSRYHALGFLCEHSESLPSSPSTSQLKSCALSIDELEDFTGIDFFCNLPDNIETIVEPSFNFSDFTWE